MALPWSGSNRASVRLIHSGESERVPATGAVASVQEAEVKLPRELLDRLWSPEYLERLARAYWRYLNRVTLGLVRVVYGADYRAVVLVSRRLPLLRFRAPEYDIQPDRGRVTWPIDRGLLVAPAGRGKGYLRITVERPPEIPGEEVTIRVTSEVASFYPLLAGWGWFEKIGRVIYRITQLRLHVIVTHAFLRSLARLDLEPSVVGALLPPEKRPTAVG